MAPAFDPYYKWLGIPPAEQPPNHYRLLAINLFESDPDVIEAAADQRMVHLRSLQTGQYAEQSQELLNKISVARLCLLKPEKKAQYDQSLRQQLAASGAGAAVPPPSSPAPPLTVPRTAEPLPMDWDPGPLSTTSRPPGFRPKSRAATAKAKPAGLLPWLIGVPAAALVIGIIVIASNSDSDNGGSPSHIAPGKVASADGSGGELPGGKNSKGSAPAKNPAAKTPSHEEPANKPPRPTDVSVATHPADGAANPAPPPAVSPPDQKPPSEKTPSDNPPEKKPEKPPEKLPEKLPEKKPPEKAPLPAKPPAETRLPAPDAAAQQQALAELKDALKTDFAMATTIEARQALVKKLSKLADETNNNPALRYVMISQALDYAQKVNDPALAIDALAKLCKLYAVDSWDLRSKTFAHLAHLARTPDAHQLIAEKVLPLVDSAVAEDRYDAALGLAAIGVAMTSDKSDKLVDPVLRDKARVAHDRCRRLQHEAREIAAAKEKLAANPDDPEANLVVGRFLCLEKEDWNAGLPYLARGGDDGLKEVATRELAGPTEAAAQLALADAWWDLAEKPGQRAGLSARPMLARARYWYTRAMPGLTGLTLAKVQQRLREEAQAAQDLAAAKGIFLDDLPEQNPSVGYGVLGKHGATGFPKDATMQQVLVHGVAIKHALVTHPPKKGTARVSYAVEGKFHSFSGAVAIMDGAGSAQSLVVFRILGDGKLLWTSRPMQREGDGQEFKFRLPPLRTLQLEVQCSGENNRAWCVWINPTVTK